MGVGGRVNNPCPLPSPLARAAGDSRPSACHRCESVNSRKRRGASLRACSLTLSCNDHQRPQRSAHQQLVIAKLIPAEHGAKRRHCACRDRCRRCHFCEKGFRRSGWQETMHGRDKYQDATQLPEPASVTHTRVLAYSQRPAALTRLLKRKPQLLDRKLNVICLAAVSANDSHELSRVTRLLAPGDHGRRRSGPHGPNLGCSRPAGKPWSSSVVQGFATGACVRAAKNTASKQLQNARFWR